MHGIKNTTIPTTILPQWRTMPLLLAILLFVLNSTTAQRTDQKVFPAEIPNSNIKGAEAAFSDLANLPFSTYRYYPSKTEISNAAETTIVKGETENQYTITLSTNVSSEMVASGGGTYAEGTSISVTTALRDGYEPFGSSSRFLNWTEDGIVVSNENSYTFTVSKNRSLVANFYGRHLEELYYLQISTPGGGLVSGNEFSPYLLEQKVVLSAVSDPGYRFLHWTKRRMGYDGWEESVVSYDSLFTYTVNYYDYIDNNGTLQLIAKFEKIGIPMIATPNNAEWGSISGSKEYQPNETVNLTAIPKSGYAFVNWTENGNVVGTNDTLQFVVDKARNLVANFQLNSYAITATANQAEGGTVSGANTYNHFVQATLVATANAGYTFVNWTENGNIVGTNDTLQFTVDKARNLVANFQLNSYLITIAANPTVGGIVTGGGSYNHFDTATLTANANTGYRFVNWKEADTVLSTNATINFEVIGARTIEANFELLRYAITATTAPTDGGTISGTGTYEHFSAVTLVAAVKEGFDFVNWTENGTVLSTSTVYSFEATGARNIVANFVKRTYQVALDVNTQLPYGTISGAGIYQHGQLVTVKADVNDVATFVSWTENGVVVSTSPSYSFVLTGARNLVANFDIKAKPAEEAALYPNPATNSITLDILPNENFRGKYVIIDRNGATVQAGNVTSGRNTFNITKLAAGVYTLYVEYNNGNTISKTFVKL